MTKSMGVDVGGTGIKGGIVDLTTGELVSDRLKIATPQPATPEAVAETVAEVVRRSGWNGPVGCALPSVVRNGIVESAANIDKSWIGRDGVSLLASAVGTRISLINDADAAGIAEMRWGAGEGHSGVVLLLTFGTGIGSALFIDGRLVPNTELGHLQMWGDSAEERASAVARQDHDLSWRDWAEIVNEYLDYVESLFWPELIIVGGGVSKRADRWVPLLETNAELIPAELLNNAGIAGAAARCVEVHG